MVAAPLAPRELGERLVGLALDAGALVVCSDFDGSLAPLVLDPTAAHPLPEAAAAVAWLSRSGAGRGRGARCPTRAVIVSARDGNDVAARLQPGPEAVVIGNGGLERWFRGRVTLAPGVAAWLPVVEDAAVTLEAALSEGRIPGVRLERKRCAVVLHTRGVARTGVDVGAAELAAAVAAARGLAVSRGKYTWEVRPPLPRDKASAVRPLLRGRWAGAAVCAAGDDLGDVPLLELARRRGGIAVAVVDEEVPATVAQAATVAVGGPQGWATALASLVTGLRLPEEEH